jgi:hypothetical protein
MPTLYARADLLVTAILKRSPWCFTALFATALKPTGTTSGRGRGIFGASGARCR